MALIFFNGPCETPGEGTLLEALRTLPDSWVVYSQPRFVYQSTEANPDFCLLHLEHGLIILEVKDHANIEGLSDHDFFGYSGNQGRAVQQTSPVIQARRAAHCIANLLTVNPDLCSYAGKLEFPYRYAGVMPFLAPHTLRWVRQKWGVYQVLGRDDLHPQRFEASLKQIPAPFHMPMRSAQLAAVRAVIDPGIQLRDARSGDFKGVLDLQQESLVKSERPKSDAPRPDAASEPQLFELEPDPQRRAVLLAEDLPEEARLVTRAQHVKLVRGVAGTGKTDVLVLRARFVQEQNPKLKILVTTFNDPLYAERLKPELEIIAPSVDVIKFDTLCTAIYRRRHDTWKKPQDTLGMLRKIAERLPEINAQGPEFLAEEMIWMKEIGRTTRQAYVSQTREGRGGPFGRTLSANQKERIFDLFEKYQAELAEIPNQDWVDLHSKALRYLGEGISPEKRYDVILVDEAQHFAPDWMLILEHFLEPDGDLFLCEDPSQSLYRAFSWKQKHVEVAGRTTWLRTPYRSTRQIFEAAYALIGDNPLALALLKDDPASELPRLALEGMRIGDLPLVRQLPTVTEERAFVAEEIERLIKAGMRPAEIAILHDQKYVRQAYRSRVAKGVRFFDLKQQTGLEYQAVFLPQVEAMTERVVGRSLEEDHARQALKFYTGMTRARSRLYLLYQQKWPKALEPLRPYVRWEPPAPDDSADQG